MAYLETLKSKASEEERLEEINKQIFNLQNLKYVNFLNKTSFKFLFFKQKFNEIINLKRRHNKELIVVWMM